MFALVSLEDEPGQLSVKCDPGYAIALKDEYPGVTPGYPLDMRHWNTVFLDGVLSPGVVAEWIDDSYGLVKAGLTRSQRAALADGARTVGIGRNVPSTELDGQARRLPG